jgi:hypothetical protein
MIFFKVKDGTSQFQNFRVNFHKFHALFSMRLSQAKLSQVSHKIVYMGSENAYGFPQNAENGFSFEFFS